MALLPVTPLVIAVAKPLRTGVVVNESSVAKVRSSPFATLSRSTAWNFSLLRCFVSGEHALAGKASLHPAADEEDLAYLLGGVRRHHCAAPDRACSGRLAAKGVTAGLLLASFTKRQTLFHGALFRQQFTVPLREELNSARFEVIHGACNLDAARGFKLPKHSTLFPNVGNSQ
jgi:hypothetical protein